MALLMPALRTPRRPMAGEPKEEFAPLLPVGFHKFDIPALRRLCVDRFPQSITRKTIMAGLEAVLDLLNQNGMRGDVWVNGICGRPQRSKGVNSSIGVVGCCHLSGLLMQRLAAGPYGSSRIGSISALRARKALCHSLVFRSGLADRFCHTLLRPPTPPGDL